MSSPIVWGDRVFLSTAVSSDPFATVTTPVAATEPRWIDLVDRTSSVLAQAYVAAVVYYELRVRNEWPVWAAALLVVGVPTHGFRAILTDVRPYLRPWIPVVSLAKGFERGSLLRMTQLIREELPGHPPAALTGLPMGPLCTDAGLRPTIDGTST